MNLLGFLLVLLRTPPLLLLALLHTLYFLILSPLIPFNYPRRFLDLLVNLVLSRSMLFILGFHSVSLPFELFSRNKGMPRVASGWLCLAQHSSPVDFLLFHFLMSPTLVKVISKKEDYVFGPFSYR